MDKNKEKKKIKYKLLISEEVSLKDVFSLSLTKSNLFLFIGLEVIIIAILVALLLIFTPLKYFLPPVQNYKLEKKIVENSILVDSLEKEILLRDNYYLQINKIIKGEDISEFSYVDSTQEKYLLSEDEKDSILNNLNDRDEQKLSEIRENNYGNIDKSNYKSPLKSGTISKEFDATTGHFGIDIVATENEPVMATLPGTVLLATWSIDFGYIIQIQHPNNVISIYKHNGELLKKEGDRVAGGEPIALVGNTGEKTTGTHLHFEVWEDGTPINPVNYINF